MRSLRSQLSFMYDYIMVCKEKERLLQLFENRVYFMTGTEMLSLRDFQDVNCIVDKMMNRLNPIHYYLGLKK